MDSYFYNLHSNGIGRQVKRAKALSKDDERKLWDSGVMGTTTPRALQNAAFFIVGKMFCLRGGNELRNLKLSQIVLLHNPDRYEYNEHVSKTRNGTFKKLHVSNKVVSVFQCPEAGNQCPVYVLDLYINKLPPEAITQDIFFFRPLERTPADSTAPWYIASQPVGKTTLDMKLRKMCSLAGIEGAVSISNHSLRATSATQMFDMGVPEKIIQERTGHKSLEALRTYERMNDGQHKTVSHLLSNPSGNTSNQLKMNNYHVASQYSRSSSTFNPNNNHNISFSDLQGCTININSAPVLPPTNNHLTEKEFEDFCSYP